MQHHFPRSSVVVVRQGEAVCCFFVVFFVLEEFVEGIRGRQSENDCILQLEDIRISSGANEDSDQAILL